MSLRHLAIPLSRLAIRSRPQALAAASSMSPEFGFVSAARCFTTKEGHPGMKPTVEEAKECPREVS